MEIGVIVPERVKSTTQVKIVSWLVQNGDYVKTGDNIVQTDNGRESAYYILAPVDGRILIKAEAGETVNAGGVVCLIDNAVKAVRIPPQRDTNQVRLMAWLIDDGDQVIEGDAIAEIDNQKSSFELYAEAEGKVKLKAKEEQMLNVGDVICLIDTTGYDPH